MGHQERLEILGRTGLSGGAVAASSAASQAMAAPRESPHICSEGCKPEQHAGRCGKPNNSQRSSTSRWEQATPAALSSELIDGAMQQAAQPGRQTVIVSAPNSMKRVCD